MRIYPWSLPPKWECVQFSTILPKVIMDPFYLAIGCGVNNMYCTYRGRPVDDYAPANIRQRLLDSPSPITFLVRYATWSARFLRHVRSHP